MPKLKLPALGDWPPLASHGVVALIALAIGFLLIPTDNNRLALSSQTVAVSLDSTRILTPKEKPSFPADRYLVRLPEANARPCLPLKFAVKIHRVSPNTVISFPLSELGEFLEVLSFHKSHPQETLHFVDKAESLAKPKCVNGEKVVYGA